MKQTGTTRNPSGMRVLGTYSATNPVTPIAYAIFGIGLLVAPLEFRGISGFALAALLALLGIYYILVYIRSDKSGAFTRQELTFGLSALTGGVLLFAMPEAPKGVLPLIWGGALVVGGFAKVQTAVDMYKFDVADWWHCLIGAVIALGLGAVALYNPFSTIELLLRFIGGGLTAEALMDAYCGFMLYRLHRGKLRSLAEARQKRAMEREAKQAKLRAEAEAKAQEQVNAAEQASADATEAPAEAADGDAGVDASEEAQSINADEQPAQAEAQTEAQAEAQAEAPAEQPAQPSAPDAPEQPEAPAQQVEGDGQSSNN